MTTERNPEATKLHESVDKQREQQAAKMRGLKPSKMKRPVKVRIPSYNGNYVCGGVHLPIRGPGCRKILPGEVVIVDLEQQPAFANALAAGNLEVTVEPATRPLVFKDDLHAYCTVPRNRKREYDRNKATFDSISASVAKEMLELNTEFANAGATPRDKVDAAAAKASVDSHSIEKLPEESEGIMRRKLKV